MKEYHMYSPISEKDLHGIIQENLEILEEGLILLEHEISLPKGIPDFLCVDSGGQIVIIEVKLLQDENILFQALRYYGDVNKNRYVISDSFKNKSIDPKQLPRIILIAEFFSDDIRELATLVTPQIDLYVYKTIEFNESKRGIVYYFVSKLSADNNDILEAPKIEGHYDYLKNEELKIIIDSIRKQIKEFDTAIDEYITHSYIGFKYRGRALASINVKRQSFDFYVSILNDKGNVQEYFFQTIKSSNDNYTDTFNKLKENYLIISQLKK